MIKRLIRILRNEDGKHECPDCGETFWTWDELNAHMKFFCKK